MRVKGVHGVMSQAAGQNARGWVIGLCLLAFGLIRVFSAQQFVEAGIERAETYAGVCISADSECRVDASGRVDLGDDPSSALNLMSHLLGGAPAVVLGPLQSWRLLQVLPVNRLLVPMWLFAASIFHPPKA